MALGLDGKLDGHLVGGRPLDVSGAGCPPLLGDPRRFCAGFVPVVLAFSGLRRRLLSSRSTCGWDQTAQAG